MEMMNRCSVYFIIIFFSRKTWNLWRHTLSSSISGLLNTWRTSKRSKSWRNDTNSTRNGWRTNRRLKGRFKQIPSTFFSSILQCLTLYTNSQKLRFTASSNLKPNLVPLQHILAKFSYTFTLSTSTSLQADAQPSLLCGSNHLCHASILWPRLDTMATHTVRICF